MLRLAGSSADNSSSDERMEALLQANLSTGLSSLSGGSSWRFMDTLGSSARSDASHASAAEGVGQAIIGPSTGAPGQPGAGDFQSAYRAPQTEFKPGAGESEHTLVAPDTYECVPSAADPAGEEVEQLLHSARRALSAPARPGRLSALSVP